MRRRLAGMIGAAVLATVGTTQIAAAAPIPKRFFRLGVLLNYCSQFRTPPYCSRPPRPLQRGIWRRTARA